MSQKEVFLHSEGKEWLRRNIKKIGKLPDPVVSAMLQYKIPAHDVLEVGCANGWRLDKIEDIWGCNVRGIDPHSTGVHPGIHKGTADWLPFEKDSFNIVIYGWCLYLCDPEDYLQIASEGDRVLKDEGFLIVYDFYSEKPYKIPYKHKEKIYSYHYDFSKLWLAHPGYSLFGRTIQDETCVTILKKNIKAAFPEEK